MDQLRIQLPEKLVFSDEGPSFETSKFHLYFSGTVESSQYASFRTCMLD